MIFQLWENDSNGGRIFTESSILPTKTNWATKQQNRKLMDNIQQNLALFSSVLKSKQIRINHQLPAWHRCLCREKQGRCNVATHVTGREKSPESTHREIRKPEHKLGLQGTHSEGCRTGGTKRNCPNRLTQTAPHTEGTVLWQNPNSRGWQRRQRKEKVQITSGSAAKQQRFLKKST